MITATKIKKTLNSLCFNPKTNKALGIIVETGDKNYFIRKAAEHSKMAIYYGETGDLEGQKNELIASAQMSALALASE